MPEPHVAVPDGMSAAFALTASGVSLATRDEHAQYRAASLVKLLIALDYLEAVRSGTDLPSGDRALLRSMLRSSDDDAASELWVLGGQTEIIGRAVDRIGLENTEPPQQQGMWGYTAISAADVIKIYRYLLTEARPEIREWLLRDLRRWTRVASDGFDQSFGIPSATSEPCAIKQGWSTGTTAAEPRPSSSGGAGTDQQCSRLDLASRAMHTSGIIGPGKILVALTLHPRDTAWEICAERITQLTSALCNAAASGSSRQCPAKRGGVTPPDTTGDVAS